MTVTVAIPVLDGGERLSEVLAAVSAQEIDDALELLICDSGSRDDSVLVARRAGARVIEIPATSFHHAGTRNLLLEQARGEFVAMLTQDATPAAPDWLATLLRGFTAAERVGLVYGPYRPRADCPPLEALRLQRFFASLSPEGAIRVDRLATGREAHGLGPAEGYFTDANGCIRRSAWEQVRFPPVAYAEDHALAAAMLRGGWTKVYEPAAVVLHSHHYTPRQQMRRAFDDFRGLREVYDYRAPADIRELTRQMRGAAGVGLRRGGLAQALADQALSLLGSRLGSRADRLPAGLRRRLSLERRASFEPLDWDAATTPGQRCT